MSDASAESSAFGVAIGQDGRITLGGELDVAVVPELEATFATHQPSDQTVIDMGSVSFMDSSGLRCLLAASDQANGHSSKVVLVDVGPAVRQLLEISGTIDWFVLERNGARRAH